MKLRTVALLVALTAVVCWRLGSLRSVEKNPNLVYKYIYEQDEVERILFERPISKELDGQYRVGIKCLGGSRAELTVYAAKDGRYEKVMTTPAMIGRNGPCKQAEGDNRTPLGTWTVGAAYGIKEDPGSLIPYKQVTDDMYWRGDGTDPRYNTLVYKSDAPDADYSNDEHLIDYGVAYHYLLDMGYNAPRAPYAGSALFLHCWEGSDHPTHGCVGIPEDKMVQLLRTITPGTSITIY